MAEEGAASTELAHRRQAIQRFIDTLWIEDGLAANTTLSVP